jgi:hypothetical protein
MFQGIGRAVAASMVMLLCGVGADAAAQTATARIADFPRSDGTFYIVEAIDGKEVPNALERSRAASFNQGNRWRIVPFEREVPAGKTKLALRAIQASVMPAATIFRSVFMSGEPEVRGTAEFELKPGQLYRVNGHLDDYKREVWLEEEGGPIVGSKISVSADPALVKAMEGASYVTTNLRYDGDWISNDPAVGLPFVPVGARMKVIEFRKDRAMVLIDGRKMRVGIDRPSDETIQEFVARITSRDDPRPRLASLPDDPRAAVAAGRVLQGMSREQVVMALGRPRIDQVRSLEQTEWSYRVHSDDSEIFLLFGASGRLELVDGSRKARAAIFLGAPPPISMATTSAAGTAAPGAASAPQ